MKRKRRILNCWLLLDIISLNCVTFFNAPVAFITLIIYDNVDDSSKSYVWLNNDNENIGYFYLKKIQTVIKHTKNGRFSLYLTQWTHVFSEDRIQFWVFNYKQHSKLLSSILTPSGRVTYIYVMGLKQLINALRMFHLIPYVFVSFVDQNSSREETDENKINEIFNKSEAESELEFRKISFFSK